ncbi:hypothetical protein [Knoellia sp. Soil729]|uniref:hypothetical protein n=1 Tax=Knoellia sp. Soil729 TaxID=1736394 RepID=UPI001F1AABAC|nr:hypothetical protein [Knoellia sp. Soil729]
MAHEPPAVWALPDAETVERASAEVGAAYAKRGFGAGMAAFIRMSSWQGEFTDDYFAQPVPDPAQLGLPTEDDGSRDDPLLSNRAREVTSNRPDLEALHNGRPRLILGVGEETGNTITARATRGIADELGLPVTMFRGHHGGFSSAEGPWPGKSVEFGARLAEVLTGDAD